MPYFSGLGNLIFIGIVLSKNGSGHEIIENSWTNNATNLSILLAIPALIWGLQIRSPSSSKQAHTDYKLSQLSLIFTLLAMTFFCAITWLLAQDQQLDQTDGFVLIALFLSWQVIHIFDVLKDQTRTGQRWHPAILFDIVVILISSAVTLVSVEGIVEWILNSKNDFISPDNLGLLTGWLMVLPNAVLAFYYASRKKAEIAYSSQIGDAHICIPFCIGIFAIFKPIHIPTSFEQGLIYLIIISAVHLLSLIIFKGLPKFIAAALIGAYTCTLYLQIN